MTKILRFIKTVRYLKIQQILYQMKYRIIGYSKCKGIDVTDCNDKISIFVPELDMASSYLKRFLPERILNNAIYLLNKSFNWKSGSWKNEKATHLWNFNLHYFEYAVALGSKLKLTEDVRYFEKFKELYQDWWNCFQWEMKGDAWHPYTISLRVPNLILCYELFAEWLDQDTDFKEQLVESIYSQFCFLERNQEKNLLGNHYLENLKTLYICSVFFQDKQRWKKYEKTLLEELDEQILQDGMHYERSFMYHHIIIEDLIRIERASQHTDNLEFSQKIVNIICKMSDCIYSMENIEVDRLPLFNDAGTGVAKSGKQLVNAVRRLYRYETQEISALVNAGYYLLKKNGIKIVFDCGEMGPSYITGHGHCDALSFELFVDGYPVLVNAGTYQYQSELRSYFRSTKAHNTIQIGRNEQSDCWGEHRTADRFKIIEVQQNSMESVQGSVQYFNGDIVRREIKLTDELVIVHDVLVRRSSNHDMVSSYFRIHPSCQLDFKRANNIVQIYTPIQTFQLSVNKKIADLVVHSDGDICWYSEQFGRIEKTSVLEIRWKKHIDDITIILKRGK